MKNISCLLKANGFTLVEYLLVLAVFTALVVTPLPGIGLSLYDYVFSSYEEYESHAKTIVSLP